MKVAQLLVAALSVPSSLTLAEYSPQGENPAPFPSAAPAPSPDRDAEYYIRPAPGQSQPTPRDSYDYYGTTKAPSNTNSCKATCTATGSKSPMSCDDIGAAATDSSTSCSSLEALGCDCTGCGCGVIVDADGYQIVDGMEASGLTCDKTEKLATDGQPCTAKNTCDATTCKQYCTDADGCAFAAWNTQGGCILYNSCKITRTVASVTTTYWQVPAGQGIEDDGSCACTWWQCVNDNGLGYCA